MMRILNFKKKLFNLILNLVLTQNFSNSCKVKKQFLKILYFSLKGPGRVHGFSFRCVFHSSKKRVLNIFSLNNSGEKSVKLSIHKIIIRFLSYLFFYYKKIQCKNKMLQRKHTLEHFQSFQNFIYYRNRQKLFYQQKRFSLKVLDQNSFLELLCKTLC